MSPGIARKVVLMFQKIAPRNRRTCNSLPGSWRF